MKRSLIVLTVAVVSLAASAPRAAAQAAAKEQVPLKIDLVISRHAGDKKISSLPYSLWVTANADGRRGETSLRMGVQVPVVRTVFSAPKEGEGTNVPQQSYTYRNVGTNIDCSASTVSGGRYGVAITLNDSGIHTGAKETQVTGAAAFREFTSRFFLLLRDGQTATYTSVTDPVTGETLKVDVTLSVLK